MVSDYMDVLTSLFYMGLYANMTQLKQVSILKGFANRLHFTFFAVVMSKCLGGIIACYAGLSFITIAKESYISYFTTCYICMSGIINCLYLLLARTKLYELNVLVQKPIVNVKRMSFSIKGPSVLNHNNIEVAQQSTISNDWVDKAKAQISSGFKAIPIYILNIFLTIILLSVFRDGSPRSGLIISLAWRVPMGFSLFIYPIVLFEWKKT